MSISRGIRAATARSPTLLRKSLTAPGMIAAGYPIGGVDSPEAVARKLSAVDRCLEILSDSLGKLPNYIMDRATRERVDHPLLQLLNLRPNEAMTPFVRKKVLETSRLEGGNGYDWIIRDPRSGYINEIIPIPHQLVQPWQDNTGRIWYTVTHPRTGEPMVLPSTDIAHYKGSTRNGLVGVAVLQRASEVIATARAAQQYELGYYQNGGQPSGVLETAEDLGGYAEDTAGQPLKRIDGSLVTRKDLLREEWEKIHAGPKNAHRTAILDMGLKYTALGSSQRDAQFVESKEVSVKDIARYFGVPLYKLQEGKQAYSSNEQNSIEYVVGTLHPTVAQYEQEQTYKLLSKSDLAAGLEVRINMMAELRGDTTSRGNWYQTMRQNGVFCVNDVLALEDMPDVPGGDERQASLNYVPLSMWPALSQQRAAGAQPPKEE